MGPRRFQRAGLSAPLHFAYASAAPWSLLDDLAAGRLLSEDARVLNVLASAQAVPYITEETIKARVSSRER